jgi:hypothetical protein
MQDFSKTVHKLSLQCQIRIQKRAILLLLLKSRDFKIVFFEFYFLRLRPSRKDNGNQLLKVFGTLYYVS